MVIYSPCCSTGHYIQQNGATEHNQAHLQRSLYGDILHQYTSNLREKKEGGGGMQVHK